MPFSYMTLHRVLFQSTYRARDRSFGGPKHAVHWRFGPDGPLGDDGMRTQVSDVWGGAGFYSSPADAEFVIDNLVSELPFLGEATESWHALLCPISHRGVVNWFGSFEAAAQFEPIANDPGGRLVVLTSAGFDALMPDEIKADLPRRADFLRNVERVRAWYSTLPANLGRAIFTFPPLDGITVTLWDSDEGMTQAAYAPGIHRSQVDRYKKEHTADRTSFTRARILRSVGTWNGKSLG